VLGSEEHAFKHSLLDDESFPKVGKEKCRHKWSYLGEVSKRALCSLAHWAALMRVNLTRCYIKVKKNGQVRGDKRRTVDEVCRAQNTLPMNM